ncbi:hypothetical protein [Nocardioides sp. CER19]|uniref:hypothetical protein n=1 Tax=Nocardioides sp. CER19 TaxID=3038538 RepID=UPI00244CA18E|nr:hypothetical protein [Nocardioides sp. CER19]MDH2414440.1 hypothetical protein [Nocardioides sp. CER19]
MRRRALRLRAGISLFVLSWFPFAQLIIWVSDVTEPDAGRIRITVWTIQFLMGLIGIALAGAETFHLARSLGWRHTPTALWSMFRTGRAPQQT